MHILYSALLAVTLIAGLPWWIFQMLRSGKYRAGLTERFGRVPARLLRDRSKPVIWVHAVSVGEVLAISGLLNSLREANPGYRVLLSTTTATGQKLARDRFGEANVFYFPLDFAFAVRQYLKKLRPELVVIAETEFWPNFLRLAHQSGAKVVIVNARISDRSLPRYRRFRSLLVGVLRNVDRFLTQSEIDRGRLIEIGAPGDRVNVAGNLKFDIMPAKAAPVVGQLQVSIRKADAWPVVVCGSTVEGEEPIIIDAFARALKWYPNALLILAPRHPERFAQVTDLLRTSGLAWWRRSRWHTDDPVSSGIFLLDSIGELASIYRLATLAFVGGSLVPRGGHNILEPAHYAIPIMVGPYTENFRDIISLFTTAGAVDVADREHFADELLHLLEHEQRRALLGRHAADVVRANCGATARTVEALSSFLRQSPPTKKKVKRS